MQADASTFLHVLAFECPQCEQPVVESLVSPLRSLESVDGGSLQLRCVCGWSGERLGAQARRHLVVAWSGSEASSAAGGNEQGEDRRCLNRV